MRFLSARGGAPGVGFSEALARSIAPDGGLYVPERFPLFSPRDFAGAGTLARVAARLLEPFLEGDPLAPLLGSICDEALGFPTPVVGLEPGIEVLELFHGPTAAFKDVGARFLAACLSRVPARSRRTVLVATSGDTGGAVAAAFHRRPGFDVAILFPKGKVSPRQEKQLTGWGDNVRAFAVLGDFDACQRLAKQAFADSELSTRLGLVSANSINVGRLLPQAAYYALASLEFERRTGRAPGFIVPSGNVGNSAAALWAQRMGLPIREVVLATNANRPIPDFLETGEWRPRPTVATLANAMDVGDPSNMERVFSLLGREGARAKLRAVSVSDEEIRAEIARSRGGRAWCPHTATALRALERLGGTDWILVATAHPAKFESIVEPLLGRSLEIPPALEAILARASDVTELEPTLAALKAAV